MKNSLFIILIGLIACSQPTKTFEEIDLQGHRGARGLWPENSIPGFVNALEVGVNTLEMDLVITADSQIVVSHEPFFSLEKCLDSNGNEISEKDQLKYNIYSMTYQQVQAFDCGLKLHPRFPDQEKSQTTKPLLVDVIDTIESLIQSKNLDTVRYSIEIKIGADSNDLSSSSKLRAQYPDRFFPELTKFSNLVFEFIDKKLDWSRVTIQSFDFRVLQYFNQTYPDVRLALLIENELPWKTNIDSLGFTPEIYSCDYMLLSKEHIKELQTAGMAVIPWTVNERDDMDQLLKWGVDGIITDYPNRTK